MYYIDVLFFRKDKHIKALCANIPFQKHVYLKGCFLVVLEWWLFLILRMKKTINAQWIISTTQTHFQGRVKPQNKVLTHVFTRRGIGVILMCMTQEKFKSTKANIGSRVMVKA